MQPRFPSSIILFYEEREHWRACSSIPLADEAARWLASKAEVILAEEMVHSCGINTKLISLSADGRDHIIESITQNEYPMLWNLTDGVINFCGSMVPSVAKILKVPYFGSNSYAQGLCQNKHHWKAILTQNGIRCAPGVVVYEEEKNDQLAKYISENLRPPLFVKTACYGNNAGFTIVDPVANNCNEALDKAKLLIDGGVGPILIEEFVSGREFSVWLFFLEEWEVVAFEVKTDALYVPTSVKDKKEFSGKFYHEYHENPYFSDICRNIARCIGVDDYVRIDMRETRDGGIVPIDINSAPFLSGLTFTRAGERLKGGHNALFAALLESSWRRKKY